MHTCCCCLCASCAVANACLLHTKAMLMSIDCTTHLPTTALPRTQRPTALSNTPCRWESPPPGDPKTTCCSLAALTSCSAKLQANAAPNSLLQLSLKAEALFTLSDSVLTRPRHSPTVFAARTKRVSIADAVPLTRPTRPGPCRAVPGPMLGMVPNCTPRSAAAPPEMCAWRK